MWYVAVGTFKSISGDIIEKGTVLEETMNYNHFRTVPFGEDIYLSQYQVNNYIEKYGICYNSLF